MTRNNGMPSAPSYEKLKEMFIKTCLVRNGKPEVEIAVPGGKRFKSAAEIIRNEIKRLTGVAVPVVFDSSGTVEIPFTNNTILLGNRSTNKVIEKLYNFGYCLSDVYYPGKGGFELRTIHNPFGNGRNAVLLGSSEEAGVEKAAEKLVKEIISSRAANELCIGWLMDIELGEELKRNMDSGFISSWDIGLKREQERRFPSGSIGWGWNSLSKNAALYYMTGEKKYAEKFLSLSFPDRTAIEEIAAIDGEDIENKEDPLAGPYHYRAHNMILYWDLIEESPVFEDGARLRVTNSFARQLEQRAKESGLWKSLETKPGALGNRHGIYNALSAYTLGRYFMKYYPGEIWEKFCDAAHLYMAPLNSGEADMTGESDSHSVYVTSLMPIADYLLLSGERRPVRNGNLKRFLSSLEVLISGSIPDWATIHAAYNFFPKIACLLKDDKYFEYYRRLEKDDVLFRMGQSYLQDFSCALPPADADLSGRWTISPMSRQMHAKRRSPVPFNKSFCYGSYRSAPGGAGDYILIDGYMGKGRNPCHNFALLELRMDGYTILNDHLNMVRTYSLGMVENHAPKDASLEEAGVVGQTSYAVAEVPDMPFCGWRRGVFQRAGEFAVIYDEINIRENSQDFEIQLLWEGKGHWSLNQADNSILIENVKKHDGAASTFKIINGSPLKAKIKKSPSEREWMLPSDYNAVLSWNGSVAKNEIKNFCSVITDGISASKCTRISESAFLFNMPEPALVLKGPQEGIESDFSIIGKKRIFALNLRSLDICGDGVLNCRHPVAFEWDFKKGKADLISNYDSAARLPDGREVALSKGKRKSVQLAASPEILSAVAGRLHAHAPKNETSVRTNNELKEIARYEIKADIVEPATVQNKQIIFTARERELECFSIRGEKLFSFKTPLPVRTLHWWRDAGLLLAGCRGGLVAAVTSGGVCAWTFQSEMHPGVLRMGKQYWFNTHPGSDGVRGLGSGKFPGEESMAFVGSGCTIEIIDRAGNLESRNTAYFGPPAKFRVVQAVDGSKNLLAARYPSERAALSVLNSRFINNMPAEYNPDFHEKIRGFLPVHAYGAAVEGRTWPGISGFAGVPETHELFEGGFGSQSITDFICADFEGSGLQRILCSVNGSWSRLTMFEISGEPIYNVNFGPGKGFSLLNIPGNYAGRTILDLSLAENNKTGGKIIFTALNSGRVLALNHKLEVIWNKHLGDAPWKIGAGTIEGAPCLAAVRGGGEISLTDAEGKNESRGMSTPFPLYAGFSNDRLLVVSKRAVHVFKLRGSGVS